MRAFLDHQRVGWPVTKPLSTGNAFTLVQPIQIKNVVPTKEAATRVNPMTHIAAWCGVTPGEKAAR